MTAEAWNRRHADGSMINEEIDNLIEMARLRHDAEDARDLFDLLEKIERGLSDIRSEDGI